MSEMKLIMERWDGYLNEEFDACKGGFKVGDVLLATDMVKYLDDQEALNKKEEQIANSKWRQFGKRAKELAVPLAKLGFGATVAATGVGGVAIAATSHAIMADDAGDLMGQIFALGSKNEENNAYRQFLETFCVDQETLDLVEDKYQKAYIEQAGIVQELKNFFASANPNSPLPDITNHLVDWLNTQSPYKQSDDTKLQAKAS